MYRIVRQPSYFDDILPLVRLADELTTPFYDSTNNIASAGDGRPALARRSGESEVNSVLIFVLQIFKNLILHLFLMSDSELIS